ncbi:MAG: hypothetical protein M3Z28_02135 [Candidatus Dormibacteraeota bacterium]|nr:hypothetical protein [Candidatus Dormibacteraeota bacterium]
MRLRLPLLLGHLAGAEDQAGPPEPVLLGLDAAPVIELAGQNASLA